MTLEEFYQTYGNFGVATGMNPSYQNTVSSLPTIYNSVSNPISQQSISAGYITNDLQSSDYKEGVSGWKLFYGGNHSGDFEGNSGTFRGALSGNSLTIGTNAWHVDTSGNMWWGDFATYATAEIRISSAGAINLTTGTFSGSLSANTGSVGALTIGGALTVSTSGSVGSGQTAYATGTGWWLEYNAGTPRFSIGNSLEYIKWDGSNLFIEGAINSTKFTGCQSDGFVESASNCTMSRYALNTLIVQGSAAPGNWRLSAPEADNISLGHLDISTPYTWAHNIKLKTKVISSAGSADSLTDAGCSFFWGLVRGNVTLDSTIGSNGTDFSTTMQDHIGFFVGRDNKLYASCANGANQTIQEITGITFTNVNTYLIVLTAGSSAEFYVNNVLKKTLTQYLPSGTGVYGGPAISFIGLSGKSTSHLLDFLIYNAYELTII